MSLIALAVLEALPELMLFILSVASMIAAAACAIEIRPCARENPVTCDVT